MIYVEMKARDIVPGDLVVPPQWYKNPKTTPVQNLHRDGHAIVVHVNDDEKFSLHEDDLISVGKIVPCRAQVDPECTNGSPDDKHMPREGDSTWDGHTLVCFACYIAIEPFMHMDAYDIVGESNMGIHIYKTNLNWVRKHANPTELVAEANHTIGSSRPGSPRYISALACRAMAQEEVTRRKSADDKTAEEEVARREAAYDQDQ